MSAEPHFDGPFRDPAPSAQWRRMELLRQRRDELVEMPETVGDVYVARVARTVAAAAAALVGAALLAAGFRPDVLAPLFPGPAPAVLLNLVGSAWLLGAVAHLSARALAERRFARAMRRHVVPTANPHLDVDRLASVRPERAARAMARRWEWAATVLPLVAFAVVAPASGAALAALVGGGWRSTGAAEAQLRALAGLHLLAALTLVPILATFGFALVRREAARFGGALRIAGGLAFVGAASALLGGAAIFLVVGLYALGVAAAVAATALVLRRERRRLDSEDAAATLDWRRLARRFSPRALLRGARTLCSRRVHARFAVGTIVLAVTGAAYLGARRPGTEARAEGAAGVAPYVIDTPSAAVPAASAHGRVSSPGPGAVFEWRFGDGAGYGATVELPLGVPAFEESLGWQLGLAVTVLSIDGEEEPTGGAIRVIPEVDGEPITSGASLDAGGRAAWTDLPCVEEGALRLAVRLDRSTRAWSPGEHVIRVRLEPSFALGCQNAR